MGGCFPEDGEVVGIQGVLMRSCARAILVCFVVAALAFADVGFARAQQTVDDGDQKTGTEATPPLEDGARLSNEMDGATETQGDDSTGDESGEVEDGDSKNPDLQSSNGDESGDV